MNPLPNDPLGRPKNRPLPYLGVDADNWVKSHTQWQSGYLGPDWEAVGCLGKGGMGIVGLYRYIGRQYTRYSQVAIKQTRPGRGSASYEAGWLSLFVDVCPHIVQLVGGPFTELRLGIIPLDSGPVERIYLEYCPDGSLRDEIKARRAHRTSFSEIELWSLFLCLAKGALALRRGTEDPRVAARLEYELAHFDLKPDNVLLGSNDGNDRKFARSGGFDRIRCGHEQVPIAKIADFGLAVFAKGMTARSLGSIRGTEGYLTPEQAPLTLKVPGFAIDFPRDAYFGSKMNVWQVGRIMGEAMVPGWRTRGTILEAFQHPATEILRKGYTFGKDLISLNGWSAQIRHLVLECLMLDPEHRISAENLLLQCTRGLAAAQDAERRRHAEEAQRSLRRSQRSDDEARLSDTDRRHKSSRQRLEDEAKSKSQTGFLARLRAFITGKTPAERPIKPLPKSRRPNPVQDRIYHIPGAFPVSNEESGNQAADKGPPGTENRPRTIIPSYYFHPELRDEPHLKYRVVVHRPDLRDAPGPDVQFEALCVPYDITLDEFKRRVRQERVEIEETLALLRLQAWQISFLRMYVTVEINRRWVELLAPPGTPLRFLHPQRGPVHLIFRR